MDFLLIFLALLRIGLLLWASRLFFETYYDEIRKVSLVLLGLFAISQIVLLTLIYFEFMESKIFEKIIYYNLIWAVPLGRKPQINPTKHSQEPY
jgi:heme/copper-type cytochrome/quinol oxidase subunit 4